MSDEARNVAILEDAYRRWSESRGGSADHWVEYFDTAQVVDAMR